MAEQQNYGENICQAITIVAEELLKSVTFDKTVIGIIADDTEKESGKYRVSYNATIFDAYTTDTTLKIGTNVYVQVPNGDWSEQKLILSKKVDGTAEDKLVYRDPFDSFIDITNNIIDKDLGQNFLVANGPISANSIWNQENMEYTAYTRLGIKASFKSWLKDLGVIVGNYGLVLTVEGIMDNTEEVVTRKCILDCYDMIGNPYNFESYYDQKKVFIIDGIKKITGMKLEFFQNDEFKDNQKNLISGNLPPNIFVKDIIISLGYDTNQFENDTLMLYTLDDSSYQAIANSEERQKNNKNLQVRWIHKFEDGRIQVVNDTDKLEYDLYWYRKKLGQRSDNEYSGVDWLRFASQSQKLNDDGTIKITYDDTTNYNRVEFVPDTTLQNEYVKAIIMYDGLPIYSNIIEFNNANIVPNKTTEQIMSALTITCEDDSYGNYFLYNLGGSIVDRADSQKERQFALRFNLEPGNAYLTEAEEIEWLIPKNGTMIVLNEENAIDNEDGYYHIRYEGLLGKDITAKRTVKYKIRNAYSQAFNNNTIICRVVKDTLIYTATKELTFGPIGTAGTDYTFVLDFQDRNTALTIGSNEAILVEAKLYDNKGQEISSEELKDCSYTQEVLHYPENVSYAMCSTTDIKNIFELKLINTNLTSVPENNCDILKVTLKGWGDQDLEAYLPIPIRLNAEYYMSGPTTVIYNSLGTLDNISFFQNPYRIFEYSENTYADSTWAIKGGNKYSAKLYETNDRYILTPLSFYVEDEEANRICVVGSIDGVIVWSQPLYITHNKYPSTLINKWNGKLSIDEKNNAILAAKVAAGKKNDDNTFSGVMMGDWSGNDSHSAKSAITKNTGIYGFHHGSASFGFRDDGTAFIGKPGAGRLEFDGNSSVIQSNAFAEGKGGMSLDFDDGRILIKNPIAIGDYEYNGLKIDLNVTDPTTPFKIGESNNPNFKVDWDGTMHAVNGKFSGDISGSTISGSKLTSPDGEILLNGYLKIDDDGSRLGYVKSGLDDDTTIPGIGMEYGSAQVKATAINTGLRFTENCYVSATTGLVELGVKPTQIQMTSSSINIKGSTGEVNIKGSLINIGDKENPTTTVFDLSGVDKNNQKGIYARFA